MSQPKHILTYKAQAAIAGRKLVTFGATDDDAATASANTQPLLGVSERIGSRGDDYETGDGRVDVIVGGVAEVQLGATVARGDYLTADAAGDAVTASGTDMIVGMALNSGVSGDWIKVLINQG